MNAGVSAIAVASLIAAATVGAGCGAAPTAAHQRVSPGLLVPGPSFARPATFATGRRPAAVTSSVVFRSQSPTSTATAGRTS
jgi:hypothetical protein